MKVGLLLPRSTYYVSIAFDIINGLRTRLETSGCENIQIFTENIGFGAEKQTVYRAAEQLILQHDVDVIIGYISHNMSQLLRPLFLSLNRILIVLDSGANLPHEWPKCDNIIYHSLNNSLGAYLLGSLIKKDGSGDVAVSTCYYDGGYLHTLALGQGLAKAGLKINSNIATGYLREKFSMLEMKPFIDSKRGGAIVGIFSGDFLQWYFQEMKTHFPNRSENVYLTPFALEEKMLAQAIHPSGTVKGIATWSEQLDNAENIEFISEMQNKGKETNLFSLLGWEVGQILAYLEERQLTKNGGEAIENLLNYQFLSPRGLVAFNIDTNTSFTPMHVAEIVENGKGGCKLKMIEEIHVEFAFSDLTKIDLQNAVSGWNNSYVCN